MNPRQTGRTTEMLRAAANHSQRTGSNVLIVVQDSGELDYCVRMSRVHDFPLARQWFQTVQSVVHRHAGLRGGNLTLEDIFVDHYVWENPSPDTAALLGEMELLKRRTNIAWALNNIEFLVEDRTPLFPPDPFCECAGAQS